MRVNPCMLRPGDLPRGSDINPRRYVRGGAVLLPKLPGMALPQTENLFKRPSYVIGDGERMQSGRPGSEDFLKIKSMGYRT